MFEDNAAEMPIEQLINLDDDTRTMLDLAHTNKFDVFQVKKSSNENELLLTETFILHKQKLFSHLNISVDVFLAFMNKIQSGYKAVSYHNKTHAADVCQTMY